MTDLQAPQPGEFLLYETEDGRTRVECRLADDSLWLSQATMAELFQTSPQNITLHLKALYAEGEIALEATCKSYLQVRLEGDRQVRRAVKFYNLDAIIAVGYRVRSVRGTQILKKIILQIEAIPAELNSYRIGKSGLLHDLLIAKEPVKVEEPEVVDG